jgi:hypothetical protein
MEGVMEPEIDLIAPDKYEAMITDASIRPGDDGEIQALTIIGRITQDGEYRNWIWWDELYPAHPLHAVRAASKRKLAELRDATGELSLAHAAQLRGQSLIVDIRVRMVEERPTNYVCSYHPIPS